MILAQIINTPVFYGIASAIIALLIFAFFIFALSKRLQVVLAFCVTSGLLFFEVMAHLEILPIPIDPNIDAFLMSFLSTIFTMLLFGLIIEKINYSRNNLGIDASNKQIDLFPAFMGGLIGLIYLLSSIERGIVSWETVFPKLWYIVAGASVIYLLDLACGYCHNANTTNQNEGE